jgi:hypothetical protein
MGEILDSYYMKEYSVKQYIERTEEYLNAFRENVDIWETGNEANGEWLGSTDSVIEKIYGSYKIIKQNNKPAALTLYYNYNCLDSPKNEMFRWVNENLPEEMKAGLDYVFISYYEDDCNGYQPEWQQVFDSLHVLFPNSKLGIGECGTEKQNKKSEYINRYYSMRITTPNYIGGYFWWYYREDCVPKSKPLWEVIENAITNY